MIESELLAGYKKDFYARTGKSIKIKLCTRWEAICELPAEISLPVLIEIILDAANWTWDQVFIPSRKQEYIFRRGMIYFILVKCGFPLLKIAAYTDKEHTTIINAYRSFENRLETEPLTGKVLLEVMDFVNNNYDYYLKN